MEVNTLITPALRLWIHHLRGHIPSGSMGSVTVTLLNAIRSHRGRSKGHCPGVKGQSLGDSPQVLKTCLTCGGGGGGVVGYSEIGEYSLWFNFSFFMNWQDIQI